MKVKTAYLFILIWSLASNYSIVSASTNTILKCLGAEEAKIHKQKISGPIYKLNQWFINQFARIANTNIKQTYLKKICVENNNFISLDLLELILIEGKNIFPNKISSSTYTITNLELESILDKAPHLFFNFITDIQSLAPTSNCMEKHIPEIKYFSERFLYLEEEIDTKNVLKNKTMLKNAFKKLKKSDAILKKCERELFEFNYKKKKKN